MERLREAVLEIGRFGFGSQRSFGGMSLWIVPCWWDPRNAPPGPRAKLGMGKVRSGGDRQNFLFLGGSTGRCSLEELEARERVRGTADGITRCSQSLDQPYDILTTDTMPKRPSRGLEGADASRKRQKVVHEVPTFEEVNHSRHLQQLLTFDQDQKRSRHGKRILRLKSVTLNRTDMARHPSRYPIPQSLSRRLQLGRCRQQ